MYINKIVIYHVVSYLILTKRFTGLKINFYHYKFAIIKNYQGNRLLNPEARLNKVKLYDNF